ncbi:peptidylprolyl isomerase [Maricurvus nonylphenolicus]|uniref:FKBP-type peptidyl-prolyl cis-trans isomerase n=1 Tax=Maricurvus nonylphenolicus TaxID=1008307 RepID=UPI0036F2AC07
MKIEKDRVVRFHYRLSEVEGPELESSHDGDPMEYLHGQQGMMIGLEDALVGRETGDVFSVTLEPALAYGKRRENTTQRVPRKHLLTKGKLKVGQVVHVNTEQGPKEATVIKVGLKSVDIDSNHPLAGKTVTFDIEVLDVREATAEEVAHGHVHGKGGCGQ